MLTEDIFTAVCGPPLASNTAVAKDVAIYHQTLSPSYGVRATFKKSATPAGGLAVSAAHVFAAQQDRAYVHVYSRLRGGQEAAVPVPDKVRCLALAGDVLVAGTADGRLLLWETLSGRLITTPPCHVQAVTCLATTPHHVLSGSEDSNVHVWSLPRLLALRGGDAVAGAGADGDAADAEADELAPERTLSRHRAAITALAVGGGASRDTNLGVSAGRDKTVVLWNYQTGVALRTLLFPATPLCLALDPVARALYVATEVVASTNGASANGASTNGSSTNSTSDSGSLFAVELFGEKPLLGARAEASSTAASITLPFGRVPDDAGLTSCLAVSYDGATLLSGHARGRLLQWNLGDGSGDGGGSALPVELANLNAAVTNVVAVPPPALEAQAAPSSGATTAAQTVVKPSQAGRSYTVTTRFDEAAPAAPAAARQNEAAFDAMLRSAGFPASSLEQAIIALQQGPESAAAAAATTTTTTTTTAGDPELQRQNEELAEVLSEQVALYRQAMQHFTKPKATRS